MGFTSILFEAARAQAEASPGEPPFFRDLNLDQVVASVTADFEDYELDGYFYEPLSDLEAVAFRQEVFADLAEPMTRESIGAFAERVHRICSLLTALEKMYYPYHKEVSYLSTVTTYCDAVIELAESLAGAEVRSRGLIAFRDYLSAYVASPAFSAMRSEAAEVAAALSGITYSLVIRGDRVTVGMYGGEPDYSVEVLKAFERFQQGTAKNYLFDLRHRQWVNHVQEHILSLVARLFPAEFSALHSFCERHQSFVDETIRVFHREVQFYLAYLSHAEKLTYADLAFCRPDVVRDSKDIRAVGAFDVALADVLQTSGSTPVLNDFELRDPERIFVVSGPNQGGKTTFARMFGQLHYLASLGCPVPAREARLLLFDRMFTHFEREEQLANRAGKLEDDLVRARDIVQSATERSVVIVNEIFTSTTLEDALYLGTELMRRLIELGCLGVFVTFIDELSAFGESTVSLVSTVAPDDATRRTFKLVRKPADGLAYALAIAEKHGVTYGQLKERIAS